jgi:hypothetical protein
MSMRRLALAIVFLLSAPLSAQEIYKCSNGHGGNTYQQVPCAKAADAKGVRSFKRVPDSRQVTGQYGLSYSPPQASSEEGVQQGTYAVQPPADRHEDDPSGYVRCTKSNGATYLQRGSTCRVQVAQKPGMVLDVTTGQQHFMIPGGGNGMIDPATGQRHELISPPPTRQVQGESASRAEVCADAQARLSDPNRTMDSIRAAEARAAQVCGR